MNPWKDNFPEIWDSFHGHTVYIYLKPQDSFGKKDKTFLDIQKCSTPSENTDKLPALVLNDVFH